jgi:hypothetical protein
MSDNEFLTVAVKDGELTPVLVRCVNGSQIVFNPGKPLRLLSAVAYHALSKSQGKLILVGAAAAVAAAETLVEAAVKAVVKRPGRAARAEVQEELPLEEPAADIAFMPAATSDE